MAYVKEISPGVFESYGIQNVYLNVMEKEINVSYSHITILNGVPSQTQKTVSIINYNEQILDPAWDATSTPPKPAGFSIYDPDTWGTLTEVDFPFVLDTTKQYFDTAITTDGTGTNIYERIKNALYTILADMGELPPTTDGWIVQ